MTFQDYTEFVGTTSRFKDSDHILQYFSLKLCGESGEVAEKIGKLWRNLDIIKAGDIDPDKVTEIVKELGDVLWYVTAIGKEFGYTLEQIAFMNIMKLKDRAARGVICSEGDNR